MDSNSEVVDKPVSSGNTEVELHNEDDKDHKEGSERKEWPPSEDVEAGHEIGGGEKIEKESEEEDEKESEKAAKEKSEPEHENVRDQEGETDRKNRTDNEGYQEALAGESISSNEEDKSLNVKSKDEASNIEGIIEELQEESQEEVERHVITRAPKKEIEESKVRKVDMEEFFPDESAISIDTIQKSNIEEEVGEEGEVEIEAEEEAEVVNTDSSGSEQSSKESLHELKSDHEFQGKYPSFLKELFVSEEELSAEWKTDLIEDEGESREEDEPEEIEGMEGLYPERELSDKVYEKICEIETPLSTDESFSIPKFKCIDRRKPSYTSRGAVTEEDPWLAQVQEESQVSVQMPAKSMDYLVDNVMPGLKETLLQIAKYQPQNPVRFLALSLLHKNKNACELGLDPDPRLIQAVVDAQKKKRKSFLKKPSIFAQPVAESGLNIHREPSVPEVQDARSTSTDDEDLSHIARIQRKYNKAKTKMVIDEKEKRAAYGMRSLDPGTCLGPTSLPLPIEPRTPAKL